MKIWSNYYKIILHDTLLKLQLFTVDKFIINLHLVYKRSSNVSDSVFELERITLLSSGLSKTDITEKKSSSTVKQSIFFP